MAKHIVQADAIWGHPGANAILVERGRVVAVGDARDFHASETLRFEGTALPGLTDAHTHPLMGAQLSRGVDLTHVTSLGDLQEALRRALQVMAPDAEDPWIFGWGLEHSLWGGADPHRRDLDVVTTDVPIAIRMFDGHSMVVNSAALSRAGVTGAVAFDTGSHVAVDTDGPTGFIVEMEAMRLIERAQPAERDEVVWQRLAGILEGMSRAGLTGTHVMDTLGDAAAAYRFVEANGQLPLRLKLHSWVTPGSTPEEWASLADRIGEGGERWRFHGIKFFIDGTIDNGTAWLRQPDRDGASIASAWSDPTKYAEALAFFASRGIGTATHAIGDAGVLYAAEAIKLANTRFPGVRHRIEHLELTGDDVIERVRESGAVASMQPTHCTHFVRADGTDNWSARVGSRRIHAWRSGSLAKLNVPLAMGSDWPIAAYPPLPVIAAARLRRPAGRDSEPVLPTERVEISSAIAAYTSGAAYAAGTEGLEGGLEPGMRADVTVVDVDPLRVDPDRLADAAITATLLDGQPALGA